MSRVRMLSAMAAVFALALMVAVPGGSSAPLSNSSPLIEEAGGGIGNCSGSARSNGLDGGATSFGGLGTGSVMGEPCGGDNRFCPGEA